MNKKVFFNAVRKVENLDVFEITNRIRNLSLDDSSPSSSRRTTASSSSTTSSSNLSMYSSTSSILNRFQSMKHSELTRQIMEFTKSPFIDIPKTVTDLTTNSASYLLSLGFRFMPGQGDFLLKDLQLPETIDGLKGLRDKLGLTLAKDSLYNRGILKFKGFSEIHAKGSLMMNRVLLEAITYNYGFYGRFLILVQVGVGCTVWYGFAPGDGLNIPLDGAGSVISLFSPIENYEQFFYNPDTYVHLGFEKLTLMQNEENTISVLATAYTQEQPFVDIKVPNTSHPNLLLGVTLGLVVVVLLSVGISPIAQ